MLAAPPWAAQELGSGCRDQGRRIARAVAEVLDDPRYRAAAAELGRAIARDAAGTVLVDELEAVPSRA